MKRLVLVFPVNWLEASLPYRQNVGGLYVLPLLLFYFNGSPWSQIISRSTKPVVTKMLPNFGEKKNI